MRLCMNPEKLPSSLFYIRGIMRNRLTEKGYYYNHDGALELLGDAYFAGVPIEELEDIAKSLKTKTWTNFRDSVIDAITAASEGDEEESSER